MRFLQEKRDKAKYQKRKKRKQKKTNSKLRMNQSNKCKGTL